MECRGAIHCAHLGSRGIPQGAMNCAPTPCAYLKGIDRKGQPYYTRAYQADSPYSRGDPLGRPGPLSSRLWGQALPCWVIEMRLTEHLASHLQFTQFDIER